MLLRNVLVAVAFLVLVDLYRYGVVDAMKKQWRETEVIGEIDINGTKGVQMLCYFGSSTYNTKEFSVLLDGLMNNMRDLGLDIPPTGDLKRALEQWEKTHG